MNLFWLDSLLKEYVVRPPNDFFLIDYSCLGDIEFNSICCIFRILDKII